MSYGLLSGILWGLDTVLLGIALKMFSFISTQQALFLAPFVSSFLHDLFSSIWIVIYMMLKKQISNTITATKTRSGKFIMLGAILGGTIGMTGYIFSIKYIGAAYTAIISSLYPAVGAFFSVIFLKEKLKEMEKIHLERLNVLQGIVKTTIPLEEYEYNALVEKLEKKYNKDIILKKIIDPEILGGIYVRIGNDVIDGTVRTRLDDLRKLMLTTE